MRAARDTERQGAGHVGSGDGDARRRFVVEAAMLVVLVGLALAFVVGAPS